MTGFRNYRTASGMALSQSLARYGERVFDAVGQELYREGTEIQTASLPLVPVDTGALRNSSYVSEPERQGDHVIVEVGFGGVATKTNPKTGEPTSTYALIVHEDLEAHHHVGQALYLTTAADERTQGMSDRIASGVDNRLKGAGGSGDDQMPGMPE